MKISALDGLVSESQSLWVRDRFLIFCFNQEKPHEKVAIPLGQGQVFNTLHVKKAPGFGSQSLWVRGRFLIVFQHQPHLQQQVAIPLGQGQVFNGALQQENRRGVSQSLWARDRFLIGRTKRSALT